MGSGIAFGLLAAVASGFAAILAGRNLTRSITAAAISIAGLGIALTASGAGFVGFFLLSVAAMSLTTIQLFGWMLVDVDRDHLPPTDRVTWIARSLAFLLLGGGLFLLVWIGGAQGSLTPVAEILEIATPGQIGELFFGAWRDLAILCGVALAAVLLATLMLLRDDGEYR